jgi:acyl-coenzyme A thioesterase PaaI-like protein
VRGIIVFSDFTAAGFMKDVTAINYNRGMNTTDSPDAVGIRRQVLLALAGNRVPGYHFPGYLLGCHWPRIGDNELDAAIPGTPQARNVDGTTNLAAFFVLIDVALATAARLKVDRGARQATVHMHAQFTGAPLRGDLKASARMLGYTAGSPARQAMTAATVYAGDAVVCHADGTFIQLPPPPGVTMHPLPWQQEGGATPAAPLKPRELQPDEKPVLRACNAALRRADDRHAFIEHFLGALPVPTEAGARCTVKIGAQHANRVGHVQGGLSLGLAAITACAAAPKHPQLSAIASWYISPGQGRALKIVSRRFHEGRSFAAVRTEVRNADGSRVLEVVSHHAA